MIVKKGVDNNYYDNIAQEYVTSLINLTLIQTSVNDLYTTITEVDNIRYECFQNQFNDLRNNNINFIVNSKKDNTNKFREVFNKISGVETKLDNDLANLDGKLQDMIEINMKEFKNKEILNENENKNKELEIKSKNNENEIIKPINTINTMNYKIIDNLLIDVVIKQTMENVLHQVITNFILDTSDFNNQIYIKKFGEIESKIDELYNEPQEDEYQPEMDDKFHKFFNSDDNTYYYYNYSTEESTTDVPEDWKDRENIKIGDIIDNDWEINCTTNGLLYKLNTKTNETSPL